MTHITDTPHGREAVSALRDAVAIESDFPGWLAAVLATVAAELPHGTRELIEGRPGSWEADLIQRLMTGTVGEDDEFLASYRRES